MTAFHRPWSYTPRRLKHVADLELALGVTRFCIHTSPHQPTQVPPPGIGAVAATSARRSSAPSRGPSWPDRGSTTSPGARGCSTRACPAVDVAVFVGEEAPVTALFGDAARRAPSRPASTSTTWTSTRSRTGSPSTDGDPGRRTGSLPAAVPRRLERPDDGPRAAPARRAGRGRGHGRRPAAGRLARRWPTTTREHARLCDRLWAPGRRARPRRRHRGPRRRAAGSRR